jgi:hypothetical protein
MSSLPWGPVPGRIACCWGSRDGRASPLPGNRLPHSHSSPLHITIINGTFQRDRCCWNWCQSIGLVERPDPKSLSTFDQFSREVLSALASGKWVCQAHEIASDVQSCECYAPRQTDMIMWSRRGHHFRKIWPQQSLHFQSVHRVPVALGIQTHVLQIWS